MIEVQIGDEKRDFDTAHATRWIHDQIANRRKANVPVCVKVFYKKGDFEILLLTSDCPRSGPGRQPSSRKEQEIWELWKKRRLDQPDFNSGDLVSFLRQLERP